MEKQKHLSNLLPPKEFWEDEDWAFKHYNELVKSYPDQWVAIIDKQVISWGTNMARVRKTAKLKTKRDEFPVIFVEKGIHVYPN